ncbi:MAG: tetratricopeptide repeat protein [Campylobacterales bacterium]
MQGLYIGYRDPLFGIIIFVALIGLIALLSYGWGLYAHRRRQAAINSFLKELSHLHDEAIGEALAAGPQTIPAMLLLAEAFLKSGEYQQAIAIYLAILNRHAQTLDPFDQSRLLGKLGRAYAKAGFLERAKIHLQESLRLDHANTDSLKLLAVVLDRSGKLSESLEVWEVLEAHGVDASCWRGLAEAKLITHEAISPTERLAKLEALYRSRPRLTRFFYREALTIDPERYILEALNHHPLELLDLLWNLEKPNANLDTITSPEGRALMAAKGWIVANEMAGPFELEILAQLQQHGHGAHATLGFEYLCTSCKQMVPIDTDICPHCFDAGTLLPEPILQRPMKERLYE